MTTGHQESGHETQSSPPTLSRECKGQLAILIANLMETQLSIQDAELDREPADQTPSSSSYLDANTDSIKEDCHADSRSAFV